MKLAGIFLLALFLGLLGSFVVELRTRDGLVGRGVVVDGVALGGLDKAQTQRRLEARQRERHAQRFSVVVGEKTFEVTPGELGLDVAVPSELGAALDAGHRGALPLQLGFWLRHSVSSLELPAALSVDGKKFDQLVDAWEQAALPAPTQPRVSFERELQAIFPEPAMRVDRHALGRDLLTAWRAGAPVGDAAPAPLRVTAPLLRTDPKIQRADVERALSLAQKVIDKPIVLVIPGQEAPRQLGQKFLAAALTTVGEGADFHLELDLEKLRPWFASFRGELEKPALRTSFAIDAARHVTVVPSQRGLSIDEAATAQAILAAAQTPERRGQLVLVEQEPGGLSVAEAEALGVTTLVAQFTTHHVCCEPRVKNIQSVARQIDGYILKPGEQFSLNEFLGPRTNEGGYFEAPTIVRGKMKETAGGGISQFATTLFNAILRGGYEIIQRQPHSFYFSRYPEGHEATVSFPSPDLIFKNDTAFGLVIKTEFSGTFIRVLVYGNNEGRRIELSTSRRFALTPPPLELEPDDTLLPEEQELVTRGQTGFSVNVGRVVHLADGTTREQHREVIYQPRPQIFRVHSCMIPKGQKGYTGLDCPKPEEPEEPTEEAEGEGDGVEVPEQVPPAPTE